jgi:hypothetical protein
MTGAQKRISLDVDTMLTTMIQVLADNDPQPGLTAVILIEEMSQIDKVDLRVVMGREWVNTRVNLALSDIFFSLFEPFMSCDSLAYDAYDELRESLEAVVLSMEDPGVDVAEWLSSYDETFGLWVDEQVSAMPVGSLQRAAVIALLELFAAKLVTALEQLGPYVSPT